MPWSEWVTPNVLKGSGDVVAADSSRQGQTPAESPQSDPQVALDIAWSNAESAAPVTDYYTNVPNWITAGRFELASHQPGDPDGTFYGSVQVSQHIYWLGSSRALAFRDWFPDPLNGMVEGVDFDVIPGKDPAVDQDAYVEYEPAESELLGWGGTVELQVAVGPTPGDDDSRPVTGVVHVDPVPGLPDPGSAPPAWVDGSPVASVTGAQGASTGTLSVADLLAASGGSLTAPALRLAFTPTGPTGYVGPGDYSGLWRVREIVGVGPLVQMPRFRYWVPGPSEPIPLRQRQRDDNLALGVGRWRRGTSRQRSIRWAGYL